jgi:hypothetical protein
MQIPDKYEGYILRAMEEYTVVIKGILYLYGIGMGFLIGYLIFG